MKPEDFEKLSARQSIRKLPPHWKADILSAAQQAPAPHRQIRLILNEWLWPSPWAWATLAAIWLFAIGLNNAAMLKSDFPKQTTNASTASIQSFLNQLQILTEMTEPTYAEQGLAPHRDRGDANKPQSSVRTRRKEIPS